MANVIINDTHLVNIANAIREKNGTEDTYKPGAMAEAILEIKGGGGITYTDIVANEDDTLTLIDIEGVSHTLIPTYDDNGAITAVTMDGIAADLTYTDNALVAIGNTTTDFNNVTVDAAGGSSSASDVFIYLDDNNGGASINHLWMGNIFSIVGGSASILSMDLSAIFTTVDEVKRGTLEVCFLPNPTLDENGILQDYYRNTGYKQLFAIDIANADSVNQTISLDLSTVSTDYTSALIYAKYNGGSTNSSTNRAQIKGIIKNITVS